MKMRVVFGLGSLGVGGMERQFVEQVKFFDREKFEIILITLFQFPNQPELYSELPADLEVHKFHFKGFKDLASWRELYRLLKELKPDLVVSSLFFANTVFRVLKPLIGYRSIAREHNTYTDKTFFQKVVDRILASVSATIVTVSTTVADFTARQEGIPRGKFTVIRNGIDAEQAREKIETLPSRERLRQEMGLRPADLVFLNIARLVPQKDHRLLIDGFLLFLRLYPEAKLLIVGDGGKRASLEEKVCDAGATENITFFGHRDDVWRFYKVADAFVSTSQIEGLSNAYLEALAVGLPVVATRTAGTDELLHEGENGYFIEERTPERVVDSMTGFAEADNVRLSEAARMSVRAFDIRETVKAYEALFRATASA
jgi:glycosyltransferase involved in cell wall biosynthesis